MELYRKVRLACRDGMSERAAARHFGVSRQSVRKMLEFSVPPGYRRTAPVRRPKLDEFTGLTSSGLGTIAATAIGSSCTRRSASSSVFVTSTDSSVGTRS